MSAINALWTFVLAVMIVGGILLALVAYMAFQTWRRSRIVYSERIAPDHGGEIWREKDGSGREYVRSTARRRPWEPLRPSQQGGLARMLSALSGRVSRF